MRHESIDGVVVRVRDYGDHDRYLSVLTADAGRITVLSKGGHSLKGPQTAISQLYTYANFEYYRKGEFNILKGGSAYQHFYALSMDIDRLNLAAYPYFNDYLVSRHAVGRKISYQFENTGSH